MKKGSIIFSVCVILMIALVIVYSYYYNKNKKTDTVVADQAEFKSSIIYDSNGILIYDGDSNEIDEVVENTTVQGMVEVNYMNRIYMFNGQHFGELGVEMKEYTRANISDKKQECIDYCTSEKYDTSYIQDGDIIICTGDLIKYKYNMRDNDFDTKDNPIIVLKSKDYDSMKKETINSGKEVPITIMDYYDESGDVYIKYDIYDKEYHLPFVLKLKVTDDAEVIGDIVKGSKIKIQYKELNKPLDELELKSIEVRNRSK